MNIRCKEDISDSRPMYITQVDKLDEINPIKQNKTIKHCLLLFHNCDD